MGICFSNPIKAAHTGVISTVDDGTESSNSSSKRSVSPTPRARSEDEILQSSNLERYTFSDLETAARGFTSDSVLGVGGFGSVYKGWINQQTLAPAKHTSSSTMAIAVKRLNIKGSQGHKEWLAEINYLGHLRHPNILKLIGYCLEGDDKLLVYEYMQKGSLDNHLFRRGFQLLSWSQRMKIALGAARGLAFLHNAETSNYNAKLSDFGLARDGSTSGKSYVSTRVIGTRGYFSPEYACTGHLTTKSDVYSFGVVLLEILTGRRAIDNERPMAERYLIEWAKPYLTNKRRICHVMDTHMQGQYPVDRALQAATLALRCISKDPKSRPNMDKVIIVIEQLLDSKAEKREKEREQEKEHMRRRVRKSSAEATPAYPRPALYA